MNSIFIIQFISIYLQQTYADQSLQCGDWQVFKDEKCYKVLDTKELQSYDDARNTCYENEASTLVSIRSQEEQDFMFNLLHNTHNVVNDVWIGGQLIEKSFKWTDNTTVNYTNWANNYPIAEIGYDCVKMLVVEPYKGKWLNEPCAQKNLVVCQKSQNWLFSYLQKTVMELRETVENITKELKINKIKLITVEKELEINKNESQNRNKQHDDTIKILKEEIIRSIPPGTLAYFAHTTAPLGWLKANGQSMSRNTYDNLFARIGTTFGSGDGSTTFTLPDLRGEFIRGWSDGRDVDKDRTLGSFQWGSNIPLASQINSSWANAGAVGFQSHWDFAGQTFDGGFESNVPSGQTRDGMKFPERDNFYQNEMYYIYAPNLGFINNWNVLKGTRPRNIALLACIKY